MKIPLGFGIYVSLLILVTFARICPQGHVATFNPVTKVSECVTCPQGCRKCSSFNSKIICDACQEYNNESYFMNDKKECQRCVVGCKYCSGPSISQCSFPSNGYFFNNSNKQLEKCPQGCNSCNQNQQCNSCLRGYKEQKVTTDKNETFTKCVKCQDPNCAFCQDEQEYKILKEERCLACDLGYGKVGVNKCENCPLCCPYCGLDNKMCQICAENFM